MRRFGIVLLVIVVTTVPAAAHGNVIEVDTQTSADGTVTVELLTKITDGFVVLHADTVDGPVVGHTDPGSDPIHTDLPVRIDPVYWRNVSNHTTLWAAFHRDEGAGSFDPAEDPIQESAAGDPVAKQFSVGNTDGNRTIILAEADHAQEVNTSEVTVRRVDLATDGYLVIRANDGGSPGEIVGQTPLAAGTHQNVTLDIDDHFYAHREERFSLWAVVHTGDGDGTFDAADRPVTVSGSPVQTLVNLHRTDEIEEHHHETESTPAETQTDGHHEDDHTHAETESDHHEDDHAHTDSPTAETGPTATSSPMPTESPAGATTGQTPGFGPVVALLAILGVIVLANLRTV